MVRGARSGFLRKFLRKFGEREKREKRYKKVAQGPASESEQAVLTNEENEEVTSALVCHTTRTTYDGGGKRRERNNKIPTRTHGQVRGDTQHCWTRQDQLETRACCTKSRRSRLAQPSLSSSTL